jgi:hypothetical protein
MTRPLGTTTLALWFRFVLRLQQPGDHHALRIAQSLSAPQRRYQFGLLQFGLRRGRLFQFLAKT